MRALITGCHGQVGRELLRSLRGLADVEATGRAELDLGDTKTLVRALHERNPDLILNAAAYTAVDRAESEPGGAIAVNAEAPRVLAQEAARLDIPIVHYSTDYVFDGRRGVPYEEGDATAPLNAYGRTKLIGERAVVASGAPCLVLRVGWVYGGRRRNFLTTMLELFATRDRVTVVDDELGGPTWSRDIARGTLAALEALGGPWTGMTRARLSAGLRERGGLYHLAPPDHTSWHGFAEEIRRLAVDSGAFPLQVERIDPIPRSEWKAEAVRPGDTRLSSRRLADGLGVTLDPWREGLAACLEDTAARRSALVSAEGTPALLARR